MHLTWGKKFVDLWQGMDPEEIKMHWGIAMATLTAEEMRRGVQKMRQKEYPVTLPQFLNFCRPEINATNAYYEAVEGSRRRDLGEAGTWSHPAIYWASIRVSSFDLRNLTYSQIKTRWEAALATELEKTQWDEIPQPVLRIGNTKEEISNGVAREMISRLKAGMVNKIGQEIDHKRWAKKIMERYEAGDKTLLKIQIDFAREALRNAD